MRSNEGGYDYGKLARPGEVKKTRTKTEPLSQANPLPRTPEYQTDLPQSGGIIQRRKRGRVIAPIPSNETQTLDDNSTVVRNFTRRGVTTFSGEDEYIFESIRQGKEPGAGVRARALKNIYGRARGIIRSAEKKSRKGQS